MNSKSSTYFTLRLELLLLFLILNIEAFPQIDATNTGTLFISPSTVTAFEGSFNNTATGNTSNNGLMYLKGDWINDGAFSSTGSEEFWGVPVQLISGNSVTSFFDLIIDKPLSQVLLNQHTIASNSLSLINGPLNLNTKTITVLNPSSTAIGYTNGNIISEQTDNSSKVIWDIGTNPGNHIIPFATFTGILIPFELNLTSGDIGSLTVSTYPTNPANTPLPVLPNPVNNLVNYTGGNNSANTVDRFWQIDKTGPGGTAILTFTYTDPEIPANGELFLVSQRYETNNDKWQPATPSQISDFANNRVVTPNVSLFGPFTLVLASEPLPIELLYFNASLNRDNQTDIVWTTASEINNDFFTIEKSKDGIHFEELKIVEGAGNSNTTINYNAKDEQPFSGITFYRLKQTDFNGAFSYSKINSVFLGIKDLNISIYPNPSKDKVTIRFSEPFTGKIELLDVIGKKLFESNFSSEKKGASISISVSEFSAGTYSIKLMDLEKSIVTSRLIIKE